MKKPLFDDNEECYLNSEGNVVFTKEYLLKRGYCCGCGCLHCPYEYKNVVDRSKKQALLMARRKIENEKLDNEC